MFWIRRETWIIGCLLATLGWTVAGAQSATPDTLRVATKNVPPFAFQDEAGEWTGLSFELLRRLGEQLDFTYEVEELELEEILPGVSSGVYDAGVAAMTITPDRERQVDFTHPFHTSGFGIVVSSESGSLALSFIDRIFSMQFLRGLLALVLILFIAGAALWLFERRRNPQQFGGGVVRGLGSSFWWSAVTMTTVGYGDKAPVSLGGRLVALIWMFASVITISSFTAAIATTLTIDSLTTRIEKPSDLRGERVAVVNGTTGVAFASDAGARTVSVSSISEGFAAVADGSVVALVHDRPLLAHAVRQQSEDVVQLVEGTFGRQDYGFVLRFGSPLRKRWNVAMLEILASDEWRNVLTEFLGTEN